MADTGTVLSEEERKAVQLFLHELSLENAFGDGICVTDEEAIKFLMARKFDVGRAISLFHANKALRCRFELEDVNPNKEPLLTELFSGKFTILDGQDNDGAKVCLFYAKKHFPKLVEHITVLQSFVYQLDHVMTCRDNQRNGLSLVYDMSDSSYHHFDLDLAMKVLHLLKGGYPARLRHVYIVTAPLWFKASLTILTAFLRDKIRDRMEIVQSAELIKYIPKSSLPLELGGLKKHDHRQWIEHCIGANRSKSPYKFAVFSHAEHNGTQCIDSLKDFQPVNLPGLEDPVKLKAFEAADTDRRIEENGFLNDKRDIFEDKECHSFIQNDNILLPSDKDDISLEAALPNYILPQKCITNEKTAPSIKPPRKPLPAPPVETVYSPVHTVSSLNDASHTDNTAKEQDSSVESLAVQRTVDEFVTYMTEMKRKGIHQEYDVLRSFPVSGNFESTLYMANLCKNRYNNILAFEETRVHLPIINNDPFSDYINANFVHGYKKKKKFICTQGPIPQTFFDFWRMIWEHRVVVIVMITRCVERGRVKCGQYWPEHENESMEIGSIKVSHVTSDEQEDYTSTLLELKHKAFNISRRVCHIQFTSWPDFGVLHSALPIFEVIDLVDTYQKEGLIQINNELQLGLNRQPEAEKEYSSDEEIDLDLQASGEYANLAYSTHHSNSLSTKIEYAGNSNPASECFETSDLTPPIVIHCSAGVGRTGTFCCLSNSMERFSIDNKIDIFNTVKNIRNQRAFSVQTPEQYEFCYTGIIEGAIRERKAEGKPVVVLEKFLNNFLGDQSNTDSE